jgi:hypothetical protein
VNEHEMDQDPRRDPLLAAALRAAHAEPPASDVDWDALRSSIRARAELPLARRRREAAARPRFRWARPLVPAAVAAGIALALIGRPGADGAGNGELLDLLAVEQLLNADVSEREFRLLVAGYDEAEELLRIAVGEH